MFQSIAVSSGIIEPSACKDFDATREIVQEGKHGLHVVIGSTHY